MMRSRGGEKRVGREAGRAEKRAFERADKTEFTAVYVGHARATLPEQPRGNGGNVARFAASSRARSTASYAPPLQTLSVVALSATFRREASSVAKPLPRRAS